MPKLALKKIVGQAVRNYPTKIKIVIHEAEEGGYWAEVLSIPGCATQGDTFVCSRSWTSSPRAETISSNLNLPGALF
jgi:hypothetical protein